MATYDAVCTRCSEPVEIIKHMRDPMPLCAYCGGQLKQVYHPAPVHYKAEGFTTNENRFKSQLKPGRWEKFERERRDIEARAAQGRLTADEKALDLPAPL